MSTQAGSRVLRELEQGLSTLRADVRESDATLDATSAHIEQLTRRKLDAYKALAEHRLAQLERGDVMRGLDTVSKRIARLVDERRSRHEQLLADLRADEGRLGGLEGEREQQRQVVEDAVRTLDEEEAVVQASLEADPAFTAQLEQAHRAEAIANEAEAKAADARADQQEKGKPYESDRLFMYLWDRGYGTSEYRANPVSRMLDRWVARLCDYDEARPNYWMLNEIPLRLEEHARQARAVADTEFEKLESLERAAAATAGVSELQRELEQEEARLESIDEEIRLSERRLAELRESLGRFVAGDDELMQQILKELAGEMQSEGIRVLQNRAAATPERTDDDLVARIIALDDELELMTERLRDLRKLYSNRAHRSQALERVRGQFKRNGYDDLRSVFVDSGLISAALGEFLRGVLDEDDLWRQISRQYRNRTIQSKPDFGSAGFPRRTSTWGTPRSRPPVWGNPRPGSGGFRLPRGGGLGGGFGGLRRRGGGGFSTGGGF